MTKKQIILSPNQSASFAMGRVLIEIEGWQNMHQTPLEVERGILIDFAVQHPRSLVKLVPEVKLVLEANQQSKGDFGDLFALKHFGSIRERYLGTLNDLIARGLIDQTSKDEMILLGLTNDGIMVSNHLSSAYSLMLRELSDFFCASWKRKPVSDLVAEIKTILPRDSDALIALGEPFGEWMSNNAEQSKT